MPSIHPKERRRLNALDPLEVYTALFAELTIDALGYDTTLTKLKAFRNKEEYNVLLHEGSDDSLLKLSEDFFDEHGSAIWGNKLMVSDAVFEEWTASSDAAMFGLQPAGQTRMGTMIKLFAHMRALLYGLTPNNVIEPEQMKQSSNLQDASKLGHTDVAQEFVPTTTHKLRKVRARTLPPKACHVPIPGPSQSNVGLVSAIENAEGVIVPANWFTDFREKLKRIGHELAGMTLEMEDIPNNQNSTGPQPVNPFPGASSLGLTRHYGAASNNLDKRDMRPGGFRIPTENFPDANCSLRKDRYGCLIEPRELSAAKILLEMSSQNANLGASQWNRLDPHLRNQSSSSIC